jgi:hypothetical protein
MEISFATSNEIQVFVWNRYNLIIEIIAQVLSFFISESNKSN